MRSVMGFEDSANRVYKKLSSFPLAEFFRISSNASCLAYFRSLCACSGIVMEAEFDVFFRNAFHSTDFSFSVAGDFHHISHAKGEEEFAVWTMVPLDDRLARSHALIGL